MTPVDMRDPAFRDNPYPLLLTRYPQLQWVDEAPQWRPLINLRGLERLTLRAP